MANKSFELVFEVIEPENPILTRSLWYAEKYIDEILKPNMLPIDRDYALSLIEAFWFQYIVGLAVEADQDCE